MSIDRGAKGLKIQYAIPPLYSWGNWLSVRKKFNRVMDLRGYDGLEMQLKVERPSSAKLRIALSDVVHPNTSEAEDEMWWFDVPPGEMVPAQEWITFCAPFKDFYLSYGAGTRHNDGRLNLASIIAYEINLISEGNDSPRGILILRSVRAYKTPHKGR